MELPSNDEIRMVHLDNNNLKFIPNFLFSSFKQLQIITLQKCKISELFEDSLTGSFILKEINLYGNSLQKIHPKAFSK